MKKLLLQAGLMVGIAGSALAAGGSESTGGGLMVILFFSFVGVIIVLQAIPSVILFICVIKELFTGRQAKTTIPGREKSG